jgi:hypothetical protein
MYEKNRIASFSGLGHFYGQAENPIQEIKAALPPSIAIDTKEVKQQIANPRDYIPKKTDIVGWAAARNYLRRPVGSAPRVTPIQKAKGGVYWTPSGPKFSQKDVPGGSKAENVPAPEITMKPSVSVVRDKPRIELPPIDMPTEASFKGLGEWSSTKIMVPVLCLLIAGFLLYRR